MGKASKKKRQQELQSGSILNGKSLISSEISSKWSLFNKPIVHFFLIAIVGFLVYSNTFNVPFHFDDTPNIVANYKLKDLSNFWPPSGTRWFGYLPFALNYHFGGLNTIGYHIVNIAIHIFNAILVYWLMVLTFKTPFFSNQQSAISNRQPGETNFDSPIHPFTYLPLFIALIFVSHPIQTQAVTYIVQRFTSLASMFYLLSLVMYIKFRSQLVEPSLRQSAISSQQKLHVTRYTLYAVSLISAILAMKTKEISFTLPVIIALFEFMFFEGNIKKRMLYLIPMLLTMLIIPLSLIGIDKPIGDAIGELREASQETEEIPRWGYLLTQFRVVVTYIRLLFLPINQNLDYDYPLYHSFFEPNVFLSFLFLLLIFGLGVYLFYRSRLKAQNLPPLNPLLVKEGYGEVRLISFGIFWFFITLSVESSIIPIVDVIFEHRLYLPSVGVFIAITTSVFILASKLKKKWPQIEKTVTPILALIIIVFSIAAYARNIVWQDKMSLWEDVVKKSPEKARGHYNLGIAYYYQGRLDEAIQAYHIALRLKPDFVEAYNNLGIVYHDRGRLDEAIQAYHIALRLKPDFVEAYNNLGATYKDKGLTDMAIEHYQIALRINPDNVDAHYNLGVAYERKGLQNEAIKQYQTALRLNPKDEEARNNLNRILRIQRSK